VVRHGENRMCDGVEGCRYDNPVVSSEDNTLQVEHDSKPTKWSYWGNHNKTYYGNHAIDGRTLCGAVVW
jgi:hypothetical protein